MERISQTSRAILAAAIACCSALAQSPNQIVSTGFGASFDSLILPTVSPGSIVTLFTTAIDAPDAVATQMPPSNSLSGVRVMARVVGAADTRGYPESLRIFSIYRRDVTEMPNGAR